MSTPEKSQDDTDIVLEDEGLEELDDLPRALEKLKRLKKELSACKKERAEYLTGWQRAKADFVNAKKQDEEDRKQFMQFAERNLLLKLTPILESFDMAMGNKEAWEKVPKEWRVGVEYIQTQMLKILQESGLTVIDARNVPFNPAMHAAIENVSVTDKAQDGMVVQVIQKGYELHGKVLKPARVTVGVFKEIN